MGPKQVLPLQVRVDIRVTAMKEYTTLRKTPESEPPHQIKFSVMLRTRLTSLQRIHSALQSKKLIIPYVWQTLRSALIENNENKMRIRIFLLTKVTKLNILSNWEIQVPLILKITKTCLFFWQLLGADSNQLESFYTSAHTRCTISTRKC